MIKKLIQLICPAGQRQNPEVENCISCASGTYNHGNMPKGREFCYNIVPDSSFSYLNTTDIQCSPGYSGIPKYEDGEYEHGCILNNFAPSSQPTLAPTLALAPTQFIIGVPTILQLFIIMETMLVSGIGLYFVYKLYKRYRQNPPTIELTHV